MRTKRSIAMATLLFIACGEDAPKRVCEDSSCEVEESPAAEQADDGGAAEPRVDARVSKDDARVDPSADEDAATPEDASAPAEQDAATQVDASKPPSQGSSGCGKADAPEAGPGTIDVDGTEREYIVALPRNYDPNKKYKLVYAWHGLGGTAAQIARYWYGLQPLSMNSTIFVAGQGLATQGGAGWPNTNGRDVAFVKALHEQLRSSYCIDEERVFSTGMSYGGIMSNTLGCQMGDVFRAIAPIAGMGPGGFRAPQCVGQVAVWVAHGNQDNIVTFSSGEASRDHWLKANHCETASAPTEPSPCVAYEGCDDGHPVHWCEFDGGHIVPQFSASAIWRFFDQF